MNKVNDMGTYRHGQDPPRLPRVTNPSQSPQSPENTSSPDFNQYKLEGPAGQREQAHTGQGEGEQGVGTRRQGMTVSEPLGPTPLPLACDLAWALLLSFDR